MSAGRSFAWQSGVSDYTVEGVIDVVFEPGHVVFIGPGQRVLLAERNDRVSHLRETTGCPCADCQWIPAPRLGDPSHVVLAAPCAAHRGSS